MLKLIYTETGLHLERLVATVETVVAQRTVFALRLGQSLYIETSRASFLLPADLPEIASLKASIGYAREDAIEFCRVDEDDFEVSLRGVWLAADRQADAGMFLTTLDDRTEFFLSKLWQHTQAAVSFSA